MLLFCCNKHHDPKLLWGRNGLSEFPLSVPRPLLSEVRAGIQAGSESEDTKGCCLPRSACFVIHPRRSLGAELPTGDEPYPCKSSRGFPLGYGKSYRGNSSAEIALSQVTLGCAKLINSTHGKWDMCGSYVSLSKGKGEWSNKRRQQTGHSSGKPVSLLSPRAATSPRR